MNNAGPSAARGAEALIVIGTSTGGLTALRTILAGLPPTLPAAICVVQHIGDHPSNLAALLAAAGSLPVTEAQDGDPIEAGAVHVAPSSGHLIVGPGHLHVTRGPRENFARPAIDPLFRSAAERFGPAAIGVVLTGQLNDGTAGLYEIKRRGGIAVVQDPDDADSPSMPRGALEHVAVDHCVPVAAMPALLNQLAERITRSSPSATDRAKEAHLMATPPLRRPTALTCPECGGAVRASEVGTLLKFDCHIGHSLTFDAMAAGQFTEIERGLEASLRRMNERMELCRQMAERARGARDEREAGHWDAALRQTETRANVVSELLEERWMQPQDGEVPAPAVP